MAHRRWCWRRRGLTSLKWPAPTPQSDLGRCPRGYGSRPRPRRMGLCPGRIVQQWRQCRCRDVGHTQPRPAEGRELVTAAGAVARGGAGDGGRGGSLDAGRPRRGRRRGTRCVGGSHGRRCGYPLLLQPPHRRQRVGASHHRQLRALHACGGHGGRAIPGCAARAITRGRWKA